MQKKVSRNAVVNVILVVSATVLSAFLIARGDLGGSGLSSSVAASPDSGILVDSKDIYDRGGRLDRSFEDYSDPEKQRLREAGLLSREESPRFRLVGPNGNITEESLEAVGVDKAMKPILQAYVDKAFKEMAELYMSNAKMTKIDEWKEVYDIPPAPDGQKILEELKQNIRSSVGRIQADTLIASFPAGEYFAGFGRYKTHLTKGVHPPTSGPSRGLKYVSYAATDPVTGEPRGSGGYVVEEYREWQKFPGMFP